MDDVGLTDYRGFFGARSLFEVIRLRGYTDSEASDVVIIIVVFMFIKCFLL